MGSQVGSPPAIGRDRRDSDRQARQRLNFERGLRLRARADAEVARGAGELDSNIQDHPVGILDHDARVRGHDAIHASPSVGTWEQFVPLRTALTVEVALTMVCPVDVSVSVTLRLPAVPVPIPYKLKVASDPLVKFPGYVPAMNSAVPEGAMTVWQPHCIEGGAEPR